MEILSFASNDLSSASLMKPTFFDCFDSVMIVNLPERADRRREVVAELSRVGANYDNDKIRFFPAIRPVNADGFPSIGARGCFLSHLEVLRAAERDETERLLVLEDDVDFNGAVVCKQSSKLMNAINQTSWDLLWLGHELPPSADPVSAIPFTSGLRTTHCYAVHRRAIRRVVHALEEILGRPPGHPRGGPMHVDGAYSTFCEQNPDVARLIISPSIASQRSSKSDIANNRWFDRTPLVRNLAAAARRFKNSKLRSPPSL